MIRGMGKKGGFYHVLVASIVILLAGVLWAVLNHNLETIQDTFDNLVPENVTSSVHNTETIRGDNGIAESWFYFSMFIFAVVLLFWGIKRTQEEASVGVFNR